MAELGKLKRRADKGAPPAPDNSPTRKGAPPPPERTNENLNKPPRGARRSKGKIEFSVPKELLEEFALEAGRRFGFKKGSKSVLFIAMWEEYKHRLSG